MGMLVVINSKWEMTPPPSSFIQHHIKYKQLPCIVMEGISFIVHLNAKGITFWGSSFVQQGFPVDSVS